MDEIDCELSNDIREVTITARMEPTEYLEAGTLGLEFFVIERDEDYTRRKRRECTQLIASIVSWIKSYQQETKTTSVDCNIVYFENTLLHAAIQMYDIDLVKRLLRHGSESSESTLALARELGAKANCGELATRFGEILGVLEQRKFG